MYLTRLNGRLRVAGCGGPLAVSYSQTEPCCCGCRPAIGTTITFSEYPQNTQISDQYKNQGIIFSGDSPFITDDGANPTTPVLSGSPRFFGNIGGRFVDPTDGSTPITLRGFSLDAGYFDNLGETTLEWYDENDNLIGSAVNNQLGIQNFNISVQPGEPCIRRWYMRSSGSDSAGFAIDNVSF